MYKKQIAPNRSMYSKLIKACGRPSLVPKINSIFQTMPQTARNSNPLYYNSFINDYSSGMKAKKKDEENNNNSMLNSSMVRERESIKEKSKKKYKKNIKKI
jgi:hypothetical protein